MRTANPSPRVNTTVLMDVARGNPERALKYARLFMVSIADILQQTALASAGGNLDLLAGLGHRGNNAAKNMGAHALSEAMLTMEEQAIAGNPDAFTTAGQLPALVEEVAQALRGLCGPDFDKPASDTASTS